MIEIISSPEYVKMYDIAEQIIRNDYQVVDANTGKPIISKPIGVVINNSGKVGLLVDAVSDFSLNEVYMEEDKKVYISSRSIGPIVNSKLDIAKYNARCTSNTQYISDILYLKHIAPIVRK